jgi:hypothetical protein
MLVRLSNVVYWLCTTIAVISLALGCLIFVLDSPKSEAEFWQLGANVLKEMSRDYGLINKGVPSDSIEHRGHKATMEEMNDKLKAFNARPKPSWLDDRPDEAWSALIRVILIAAGAWLIGRATRYVLAGR